MKARRYKMLCAALLACGLLGAQASQAQGFTDLGPSQPTLSGLSASGGLIAGYSNTTHLYYTWTATRGLQTIGGYWLGGDADVSANGAWISGSALNAATGNTEAALYNVASGQWTTLGSLGTGLGGSASSAWGVSGDGRTVVGLAWVSGGLGHAMKWTASGGMVDLGSSVAGAGSRANDTSFDGGIVVGWQDSAAGARQGAFWRDGTETVLADGAGTVLGEASAISADGEWIVGRGLTRGAQSWRYNTTTGVTEYLGDFKNGGTFSFDLNGAVDVSADGSVILGIDRTASGPPTQGYGTIWVEGVGLMSLTDYAASRGVVLPAGTTLALPLAMSSDGSTLSGITNTGHAFTVSVTAVPEPASYALLLGGLGLVGFVSRRRASAR
ncbi:PEP-CTERM sorting domain-containing protein [Paucibacter sp. R3-3]|uniref:PEP-CTERM sorting domain-containing protein n=1 Tax=Roseateles agri TaxID=3098619 RepID=A0ABU5DED5_9BURK|nr:PEP-CTERM sorting domain-containing protein [Paucibacter sp. R3-3]MDY0744640.1 PEP-CTERM sorting domain-containing protein [Paucibacter sp. R3-3]